MVASIVLGAAAYLVFGWEHWLLAVESALIALFAWFWVLQTRQLWSTGFWEREPDTWFFERPYDEVALILEGDADIVTDDGLILTVGPGDVLVTPKGSAGTWVIREKIAKFWVIYDG
jgi:uncharacterized cupin superfamily protein